MFALVGCNNKSNGPTTQKSPATREAKIKLPASAQQILEDRAGMIFQTPLAGTVYVFDVGRGRVIYTSPMSPGDKIVVFPDRDQIYMNGNVVKDGGIEKNRLRRLFFLRG